MILASDTDEILAKLDLQLSQVTLAQKVQTLMDSAAKPWGCNCRPTYDVENDEWLNQCCDHCCERSTRGCCEAEEHVAFEPFVEDWSGGTLLAAYYVDEVSLYRQAAIYDYEMIEGLMNDFMGNDIYRGDTVAYAVSLYHSARMNVAEYLEPAEAGYAWVRPIKTSWGGNIERKRHKVRTENMLLVESK